LGIIKENRAFDAIKNRLRDIIKVDRRIVAIEIDQDFDLKFPMSGPDLHFRAQQAVEFLLIDFGLGGDLKDKEFGHLANLATLGGPTAAPWL
jgi:hypothetical protein